MTRLDLTGPDMGGRFMAQCLSCRWLLVGIALAIGIQVAILARSPLVAPDCITFVKFAQALAANPLAAIRQYGQHPGYAATILLTASIFETILPIPQETVWLAAARTTSFLFGIGCVVLVWLFTRQVVGHRAANIAVIIFAILPVVRQNASDALSDSEHLFCYVGAAYLASIGLTSGRLRWLVLAGFLSGIGYWIRPECLGVAIVLCGSLGLWIMSRSCEHRGQLALSICAVGATAVAVAAPYFILKGSLTDKITTKWQNAVAQEQTRVTSEPSCDGTTFSTLQAESPSAADVPATELNPVSVETAPRESNSAELTAEELTAEELTAAELASAELTTAVPLATPVPTDHNNRFDVGFALQQFTRRAAESWRFILFVPLFCGLPAAFRRMGNRVGLFLYLLALFHVALLLALQMIAGYIARRHMLPLVALSMPATAMGCIWSFDRLNLEAKRLHVRWLPYLAGGLAATALIFATLPRCFRPLNQQHLHAVAAVDWIRQAKSEGDSLLSNSPYLMSHASLHEPAMYARSLPLDYPVSREILTAYTYVVVEGDREDRYQRWTAVLDESFEQVQTIVGDRRYRQHDILIFRQQQTPLAASNSQDQRRQIQASQRY